MTKIIKIQPYYFTNLRMNKIKIIYLLKDLCFIPENTFIMNLIISSGYFKRQLNILFSLFGLLLVNCDNKLTIEESLVANSKLTVIKPNLKSVNKQYDLSSILDTVKFIKLELSEESLVGSIDKLIVFEEHIYVLDKRTNSLLVFNLDGKYVSKLSKIGNGPGEYIQLDFFDIDYKNRQIVLTDLMGYQIVKYDLEGNYLSREKIPFWVEGLVPVFNDGFVVYANHRDNKHQLNQEYNIFYLDSSMQVSKAYFPYNSSNFNNPRIKFNTPQFGSFYTHNKDRYFFSPFKDQVYQITKNGLISKYRFDFGEKTFDEKYLSQKSKLRNYMEKGEFFQIGNILENDDLVIFSFYQKSFPIGYFGYYSKNNLTVICSPGFTIKGNYFHANNITTYDSWIIATVQPADLLRWSEDIDKNKIPLDSEYAKSKKNIADRVTLEDNQILMFYKLKPF